MTQSVLKASAEQPSLQVNQAADNEQMLILANRLLELGNCAGVQITITVPPLALKPLFDAKLKPAPDIPEEDDRFIVNPHTQQAPAFKAGDEWFVY